AQRGFLIPPQTEDALSAPLVSVIVPVYNGEKYLRFALESVVGQKHRPLEIIVVDDGSTDSSAAIAKGFTEVRYLHQANAGVASARNTGLKAATGAFIAFLDQDDLWLPGKLDRQASFLHENAQAMYVLCGMENFGEPGETPRAVPTQDLAAGETHNLSLGSLL